MLAWVEPPCHDSLSTTYLRHTCFDTHRRHVLIHTLPPCFPRSNSSSTQSHCINIAFYVSQPSPLDSFDIFMLQRLESSSNILIKNFMRFDAKFIISWSVLGPIGAVILKTTGTLQMRWNRSLVHQTLVWNALVEVYPSLWPRGIYEHLRQNRFKCWFGVV